MSRVQAARVLERFFRPLAGLRCWGVRQGWGSFLTFELGSPRPEPLRPRPKPSAVEHEEQPVLVRGDHHLWVEQCEWTIKNPEQPLIESEDDRGLIAEALEQLDGQVIQSVQLVPFIGLFTIRFERGSSLLLRRYDDHEPDDDLWSLFSPQWTLSYRASGHLELPGGRLVDCEDVEIVL
ncbi:MAG: hypothetical protein AAF533_10930 [Acidobacteriota bacterium]